MKSRHVVFIDCDGTLTKIAGGALIDTKHYQAAINSTYLALLKPGATPCTAEEMLQNIQKNPHDDFNLAKGALEFIRAMINNPDVDFVIVSKNLREYIQAILMYAGLNKNELEKVSIIDIRDLNNLLKKGYVNTKEGAVQDHLINTRSGLTTLSVELLDDSYTDGDSMIVGSVKAGLSRKMINLVCVAAGKFDYEKIRKDMLEKLNRINNIPASDRNSPSDSINSSGSVTPTNIVSEPEDANPSAPYTSTTSNASSRNSGTSSGERSVEERPLNKSSTKETLSEVAEKLAKLGSFQNKNETAKRESDDMLEDKRVRKKNNSFHSPLTPPSRKL